jgi:hypothetical protein
MTSNEFHTLKCLDGECEQQGIVPRGTTVKRLKAMLYDEGWGDVDSPEITQALLAMRRRRLVVSRPGAEGACWLPTIYGRNVVSA